MFMNMNYSPDMLKYQHIFMSSSELTQEIIEELLEAEIRFDLAEGDIKSEDKLILNCCGKKTILVG